MSVSTTARSWAVHAGRPAPPRVLVGVVARRPPLVGCERRDPQVVRGEGGAPADARLGVGQQCRRRARQQLVGRRLAHAVAHGCGWRCATCGSATGRRRAGPPARSRAAWSSVVERAADGVALARAAPGTASTSNTALSGPSTSTSSRTLKRCWWKGAASPGATMPACVAGVVAGDRHRRHDPGELHLELHGAVEVEVPVEPVLVVADGGDGADHQAPRPAHLGAARDHVDVLPEDAVVLLVHADGVAPSCAACRARRRRRRRSSGSRRGSRSPASASWPCGRGPTPRRRRRSSTRASGRGGRRARPSRSPRPGRRAGRTRPPSS